jgi:hypothetical protein
LVSARLAVPDRCLWQQLLVRDSGWISRTSRPRNRRGAYVRLPKRSYSGSHSDAAGIDCRIVQSTSVCWAPRKSCLLLAQRKIFPQFERAETIFINCFGFRFRRRRQCP